MFNPFRVAVLFRYSIPQVLPVAIVIKSLQDCFVAIVCMDREGYFVLAYKSKYQRDFTIIATGAARG